LPLGRRLERSSCTGRFRKRGSCDMKPQDKSFGRSLVRNRKHLISVLVVAIVSTFAVKPIHAQTTKSAADIVALLEKSGYSYTKVGDGVWEIPGKGKNVKEFGIRVALAEDILLVMVKLADRKDLKLQPAPLTKLLELNHKFDSIKVALSEEMLYV